MFAPKLQVDIILSQNLLALDIYKLLICRNN